MRMESDGKKFKLKDNILFEHCTDKKRGGNNEIFKEKSDYFIRNCLDVSCSWIFEL